MSDLYILFISTPIFRSHSSNNQETMNFQKPD